MDGQAEFLVRLPKCCRFPCQYYIIQGVPKMCGKALRLRLS